MTMISTTAELESFCQKIAGSRYITVDTEFMREKTFWPILCLIQVAGPDDAIAIDALAADLDMSPLLALFDDPGILKVFHAARQDLEIFFHLNGRLPAPVFDTQVAAMVCGFGESVGYQALAAKLAKANVDKGSRFTDWTIRPLSKRQLDYALADVTHLRIIYEKLADKMEKNGRVDWLDDEMSTLTASETYAMHPENAYRRIKTRSTDRRFLAVLREVAAWREREAQSRDLPRNRVIRDEALLEIAHHAPTSTQELSRTRGLGRGLAEGARGAALIAAVEAGCQVPDADRPRPVERASAPRGVGPVVEILKVLLKLKCDDLGVAQKLVASSADLERLAVDGEKADVAMLQGWRRDIFGGDALRLREGRLALAIRNGRLTVRDIPAD
jgi:ribonuclease D